MDGNILSILASLGGPGQLAAAGAAMPATNVLQGIAPPPMPPTVPMMPQAPVAAATPPIQKPTDEHPKKRQSAIDVIGRLADVFARVGGAEALYQPTLDGREDRGMKIEDRAREIDMDGLRKTLAEQQVTAGALDPVLDARKRLGTALGAINGRADAATLWPSVAEQAGITDPQQIAAIGAQLQQNPDAAGIFAKALGADDANLGKNVFFGTNGAGKTVAYQVGPTGKPTILDFGDSGITPNDPIKVINTGGSTAIVGSGGNVKKILPNSIRPDTVLTTGTQRAIAADKNRTAITIAGMPARAGGKGAGAKPGSGNADLGTASLLLDNIEKGFKSLHGLNALPGEGSAMGQVAGAIGRSVLGQKIGEQTGNASAQKRLEIEKDINSLQSEMVKSLPASATRTKFEQEIQRKRLPDPSRMSYATSQAVIADLRRTFVQAQQDAAAEVAGKGGGRGQTPVARPKAQAGWSLVKVK